MAEPAPKRSKHQVDEMQEWFTGRSVLSVNEFTKTRTQRVFDVALKCKAIVETTGSCDLLKGKIMMTLFYEPSTRTHSSFQAAMYRLGGKVIAPTMSNTSVKKGETLSDTVKCVECYCDIIAMRHPRIGSAKEASDAVEIPVLNGGDGAGEHPTQALLDAFTIQAELGKVDGLTVTMVGDLKHGRTVHSLAKLLSRFNCKLNYVSPAFLSMPEYIKEAVEGAGGEVTQFATEDILKVLPSTDILYVTRVQKERFEDPKEYEKVADCYIITPELLAKGKAKDTLRVLHPLPRVNEISTDLDSDPRAAYFRQMKNGMYVRMALVALALGKADQL